METLTGYVVAEVKPDGTVELGISQYDYTLPERCVLEEFKHTPDYDDSVINDLKVDFAEGLKEALAELKAKNREDEFRMAAAIQNLLALDAPQED